MGCAAIMSFLRQRAWFLAADPTGRRLREVVRESSFPASLDVLLLTATGQVVMLKVGGRTVYRAAG